MNSQFCDIKFKLQLWEFPDQWHKKYHLAPFTNNLSGRHQGLTKTVL